MTKWVQRTRNGLCGVCGVSVISGKTACKKCSIKKNKSRRAQDIKQRIVVLTHYGKNGRMECRWRNCHVTDFDMLTIDHTAGGGTQDRKKNGTRIHRFLVRENFPSGFQTLCGNHQLKKRAIELEKLREG